jgi:NADPH2:quinone reductase
MKAAFIEKTGCPEVIQFGDLPKPHPQPGEVLVRIRAAAVNPIDLYIRSGTVSMNLPKPYIPGCDLAGVVEAVGQDAGQFQPTNRVWGSNQGLMGRQGTLAEYACVAEEWLYPTPANVSDEQAAGAALTGITAHLGLFRCARLKAGETVFVNGGTGGIGSMVVQMARAVGAHVIATVGSAEKVAKCRERWTDLVLNYKTDDVDQGIRDFTRGKGVDVWFETQREPDLGRIVELVRQRGRVVLIAGRQAKPTFPVGPFYVKDLSLYGFAIFNASAEEQRHCAEDINRWLQEKKLRVEIGKTFPLSEAAAAHRLLEENTLQKAGTLSGKIIVVP